MLWARVERDGRTLFGTVEESGLHVRTGDMFDHPVASGEIISLDGAVWQTPCMPTKMIALWNNSHAVIAKNGGSVPPEPLYFIKTANAFNSHDGAIPVPASYDGRVVYEGELGIVIGRRTKAVTAAAAAAHIFGYTCVNDVTALELIQRDPTFPQWSRAKNFDGFGCFGPVIATGLDPAALVVRTLVNGRERQNYPVADLIFQPADIVSRISQDMTLMPGDVIACGTSLGVLPMKAGMTVEVVIDGIGTLRNVYGGETGWPNQT